MSMRVLTLNLWGRSGKWGQRRTVLIDGLRELGPDLVAFQEPVVSDDYDQVTDLLGPRYHILHQSKGVAPDAAHQGPCASIASRWPLSETREIDLHLTPRTADFSCTALMAKIKAPEPYGPLLFVNHLPSWKPALA